MTKTLDDAPPSNARVEALQAVVAVLSARPLSAPAWVLVQCRARLDAAMRAQRHGSAQDRRAA